jgi:O-antigen ligase
MPPFLASIIYVGIAIYLLRCDLRQKQNVTSTLWLPTIWVFISGTRFVSQWLDTFGINIGGVSVEEGSPVDAIFFGGMTLLGIMVMFRRRVTLAKFARYNPWITAYLLFCLLACVWSDFPFVAFKRWTKLFGQVVMVMVVLTEPDPAEAVYRLARRFACVLVPLSILFIKYFPLLGRSFDNWTGYSLDTGITLDKNALGYDCMLIMIVLVWHFFAKQKPTRQALFPHGYTFESIRNLAIEVFFLLATIWLLVDSRSSTSLICALVAIFVIYFLGLRWVKASNFTLLLVAAVAILGVAAYLDFFTFFITQVLGKNMTLSDRTLIWDALLKRDINPFFGTGYESFWLGERREELWALFPQLHLNSAHNGYLQIYLDMGIIGLIATGVMVASGYNQARRALATDFFFARFRLGFFIAFIIYNWTEVAFRTHCVPFFGFFLAVIQFPQNSPNAMQSDGGADEQQDESDYEF